MYYCLCSSLLKENYDHNCVRNAKVSGFSYEKNVGEIVPIAIIRRHGKEMRRIQGDGADYKFKTR